VSEKLLLVEDDPSILRGLLLNFGVEGYEVRAAHDGPSALLLAAEWKPDLVLLDLMLPRMNGYEVCRELRKRGFHQPIVILSAKGTEPDKVMGLDLGADDYVTKPFGLKELLARVKAQLRRAKPRAEGGVFRFGDVEADFAAGEVRRAGKLVEMTAKELQVLEYFRATEGRVVTRQMILDAAWGENYFGTERTVDNFLTRLRQKLDQPEPVHFLTVRGIGYRFRGDAK
jgi:DNA-binding response OmpR family regulator